MATLSYFHIAFESWAAVFCIISAIAIFPASPMDRKSSMTCIAMLLSEAVINISEVIAYMFGGNTSPFAVVAVQVSTFIVFVFIYILLLSAALHIASVITTRGGKPSFKLIYITLSMCCLGILLVILSRFFGFYYGYDQNNIYYRSYGYNVVLILAVLALCAVFVQTLKNRNVLRKREFQAFMCLSTVPVIGGIAQMSVSGISIYNMVNTVCLIILVLVHQYEYSNDVVAMERQRADERMRLFHSQIQPHFIYNCLTVIRSYLDEPEKAEEALNHFTSYLRGSMDMITENELIPAKREFETVDNYLYMEKARFEDKLTIIKDIKNDDFLLPVFTVQVMVENAVQHGVRMNPEGAGTVTLKCYETENEHVIEVTDDGPGFSKEDVKKEQSSHIGVTNIRERLKNMCGGTLEISTTPGKGTCAKVSIPKNQGAKTK